MATDFARLIGQRLRTGAQQAQQPPQPAMPRTGSALGAAVAGAMQRRSPQLVPPPVPPAAPAPSAPDFGQVFAGLVPPAQATRRPLRQEDEAWVEVVNTEDEDDYLFMPRELAEANLPANYQISGEVPADDWMTGPTNTRSIYNQPEQIQAAWGIGQTAPPPELPGVSRAPAVDPRAQGMTLNRLAREVQGEETGDSIFSTVGRDVTENWDTILDMMLPGSSPGAAEGATSAIPGTTIPLSRGVADLRDLAGAVAEGPVGDLFADIRDADPLGWAVSEGVPALASLANLADIEGESTLDKAQDTFGDAITAITRVGEAALPETAEGGSETFFRWLQAPERFSTRQRVEMLARYHAGEPLAWWEQAWVDIARARTEGSDWVEANVPGLGPVREKTENLGPLDFEEWMLENPARMAAALDEGGWEQVWETYQAETTGEGWLGWLLRGGRDVTNDPLTGLPVAGAAGSALRRGGTALRMAPNAGAVRTGTGRAIESAGETVYRTSRVAEQVADLGLEPLMDLLARGAGVINPPHATSRQQIEADTIDQALDTVGATETRAGQPGLTPDGQPVGPDAGGPLGEFTGDAPRQATADGDATGDQAGAAAEAAARQATDDPAAAPPAVDEAARVEQAQAQPEPPTEGPDATDNVEYVPGVVLRRVGEQAAEAGGEGTPGGWVVETSFDGGQTIDRSGALDWSEALAVAEDARVAAGVGADQIVTIPARYIPDIIGGQRALDQLVREMPTAQNRRQLVRAMADEWTESVERQAVMGRGAALPDHAIETSRVTLDTLDAARGINPEASRPPMTYSPGADGTYGTPHQAAHEIITQPWAATAPQRNYLYSGSSRGWRPVDAEGNVVTPARFGTNARRTQAISNRVPTEASSPAEIEAARRYADLVEQHARWHPDETGADWERAVAQAEAIRAFLGDERLVSNGGLPGGGQTARQRQQAETDMAAAQDAELVDPRYPGRVLDDGTIHYEVERDGATIDVLITPRRHRDRSYTFTGHGEWRENGAKRMTDEHDGPVQADVIDAILADADRMRGVEAPDAGDAARTADEANGPTDLERSREAEAAATDPEGARQFQRDLARQADESEPDAPLRQDGDPPPAGTDTVADEAATPPPAPPKPVAQTPPQVATLARTVARDLRPVERSSDFAGTTNTGTVWGIPLAEQHEALLRGFEFADGTTLLQRLEDLKYQYMTGRAKMWEHQAEAAALAKAKDDVRARLAEKYPARELPPRLKKFADVWDGIVQYQRERILFAWEKAAAYPMIQATGNAAIAAMNGKAAWLPDYLTRQWAGARRHILAERVEGDLGAVSKRIRRADARADRRPRDQRRGRIAAERDQKLLNERRAIYRRAAAEGDARPWHRDPAMSPYGRLLADLNLGPGREIRDLTQGVYSSIDEPLMAEKILRRIGTRDYNLGGLGKLTGSKKIARWGTYWDAAWRHTAGYHTLRGKLREAIPDFRNHVKQRLRGWGYDDAEIDRLWEEFAAQTRDGAFSADDLHAFYRGKGLEAGRAERLHRDWQSRMNTLHDETRDEIRRITYAGDETRADLVLRRTLIFHYFFSRQAWNFFQQMNRHPFLWNVYNEVQDELAEYAENHDGIVPDWMKGWVAAMGLPGGQTLFVNPVHLFSTYALFRNEMDFQPDGITDLGRWVSDIDDLVGLSPFITAAFNVTGYLGDDYAPDPLVLWREARTGTAIVNFLRARGLLGDSPRPVGNLNSDLWSEIREDVSGWLPGSEEVPASSSVNAFNREVHAIALDEARQMGREPEFADDGTPANADAIWVMEQLQDESSELYLRSVKRWTLGEVVTITTQALANPLRPRTRLAAESEAGEPIGLGSAEIHPDLLQVVSDMNAWDVTQTTDPDALDLVTQEAAYAMLGSERQRQADQMQRHIRYGTVLVPIEVNGTTYTATEIRAMDDEQRAAMASAYLQEIGMQEQWSAYKDEQDRFLAEEDNREFATYKRWQGEVYDYEGGPIAYFEEAAGDNPDARWFLESTLMNGYSVQTTEAVLASPSGYLATQGIIPNAFAPDLEGGHPDPLGIADGPERPTPYEPYTPPHHAELREEAPKVAQRMQTWNTAVRDQMVAMGLDPDTSFRALDYDTRLAIEEAVEAEGVEEPYIPNSVKDYLAWVGEQPAGADTSIEAYLAWDDARYRAGATERFEASLAGISDEEAVARLYDLWREHDHDTYDEAGGGASGASSGGTSGMGSFAWMFD